MSRVIPVILAVAALLGLSACGSDDAAKPRNIYADQVNQAQNDFAAELQEPLAADQSTTTPARGRKTLQGFEDAVDTVVGDLRRIDTPGDLQPLHRRLIDEIADYGRAIRRAKVEFATGSPQRSRRRSPRSSSTTKISIGSTGRSRRSTASCRPRSSVADLGGHPGADRLVRRDRDDHRARQARLRASAACSPRSSSAPTARRPRARRSARPRSSRRASARRCSS